MIATSKSNINNPEVCLELLEKLDETVEVYSRFQVPFEFDVCDTPNRSIALALTKLAVGAMVFNKARTGSYNNDERVAMLHEAHDLLKAGQATLTPLRIEEALVPPVVRDGGLHMVKTLILLVQLKRGPQPPETLQADQFIDRRNMLKELFQETSNVKMSSRWKETVLSWCRRQTMRTIAHHLATVVKSDIDRLQNPSYKGPICSTAAVAKRQCEILSLLDGSKYTADSIYISTKKDFDVGYRLSLPADYKPVLIKQILDNSIFRSEPA